MPFPYGRYWENNGGPNRHDPLETGHVLEGIDTKFYFLVIYLDIYL